jgi:demethylmenaquinone methyltransferase / 2-methoxy-6-polyprenyl-1,4-benzoquinol methylase
MRESITNEAGPLSPRTLHARRLFADLPGSYDRVGALLSFGQDPRWRRFMVAKLPAGPGIRVLDVATGTGAVAIEVAGRRGASVIGLDQSEPMLREGIGRARRAGFEGRITFVMGRGELLPFADASFDALAFTYLLRYVDDPAATVRELCRVVRPGGAVASLEFHVPANTAWRWLWLAYTRALMPAAGRAVSRGWGEVGRFLGPSISRFYRLHPLEEQLGWWRDGGVPDVRAAVMSLGGAVVIWGTKEGTDGPRHTAGPAGTS